MQRDWLKNSCHFFILSESKETTSSASLAVVFPRLPVSAMCFTLSFDWSTGLSLSSVSARVITLRLVLPLWFYALNIPRSIYQYSSMAPRLSGQNCKFFKFPLSLNSQKRLRYKENNIKYRGLTWEPRSHVRILIYRTWPIAKSFCFWPLTDVLTRKSNAPPGGPHFGSNSPLYGA